MLRRMVEHKQVILLSVILAVLLLVAIAFGSDSTDSFASDSVQDPCSEGAGLLDCMVSALGFFSCGWF